MSLTSFIAEPDVKARLKEQFPLSKTPLPLLACSQPRTKNYALIGTAFDYLLRFKIQATCPHAISKRWVAEYALGLNRLFYNEDGEHPELVKKVQQLLEQAHKHHEAYLQKGALSDDLLRSVICLAQLDRVYRAGILPPDLGNVDREDIEDLKALYTCISPALLASKEVCLLNPVFGCSELVGGADVDLVIDNTLIDFKTTKFLKVTQEHIYQLLGYYTLHRIAGIVGAPERHQIDTIGIYFSRHGYLHTWPISHFVQEETWPNFQKWFQNRATARH